MLQYGEILPRLLGQCDGSLEGCQTQPARLFFAETLLSGRLFQRIQQIKHIGRPAAADAGNIVQPLFAVEPYGDADRTHNAVCRRFVLIGNAVVGKHSRHPQTDFSRRIRHHADNAARSAQIAA